MNIRDSFHYTNFDVIFALQLANRRALHKSLFSATKKWFGGNKQAEKAATINTPDMGGK